MLPVTQRFQRKDFNGVPAATVIHKANMLIYRLVEGGWQVLLVQPVRAADGHWTVPSQLLVQGSPPWAAMLSRCSLHLPDVIPIVRNRKRGLREIQALGGYYKSTSVSTGEPSIQHFYALDVSGAGSVKVRATGAETEDPHGYVNAEWVYLRDIVYAMASTQQHDPERARIIMAATNQLQSLCQQEAFVAA